MSVAVEPTQAKPPAGTILQRKRPAPQAEQHVRTEGHKRTALQRTSHTCRLLALPAATLYDIARRAGPRARRLCRALRDAYGPLTDGLRLPPATCPEAALAILTHHCPNLRHITRLTLPPMPQDGARPFEDLLPGICSTLPALQSLTLPPDRALTDHHLSQLEPLAARLTALHAQLLAPRCPNRTPLHPLPRFARLSSLTLSCHAPPPGPETQAWLAALAALPQLLHLSLFHLPVPHATGPHPTFSRLAAATPHAFDASWLPGLAAAAPRLASLSLGALPVAWTTAADTALTHGFPHLTHLALMHAFEPPAPPHPAALDDPATATQHSSPTPVPASTVGALAALARRPTALRAADLQVISSGGGAHPGTAWSCVDAVDSVPQLSRLTAVLQGVSGQQAAWLWEALSQQMALTSLRVSCSGSQLPASFLHFPALPSLKSTLVELQLGWHWDPGPLVACLASLTSLRTLGLHRDEFMSSRWAPDAVSQLALLTHLESLTVTEQMLPSRLLQSVCHLTRLRQLTLTESADCFPRLLTVGDADLDHLRHLQGLTSLELAGLSSIRGCGLAVLGQLKHLQRLQLRALRMVARNQVHRFLLPLPPALSDLAILDAGVSTSSRQSLVAAAHRQECCVAFSPRQRR